MRSGAGKEFVDYILRRMSKETACRLIDQFPLTASQKKILTEVAVLNLPQKQIAYNEGRDVKTISRRYNKALEMSVQPLTAYLIRLLECPAK